MITDMKANSTSNYSSFIYFFEVFAILLLFISNVFIFQREAWTAFCWIQFFVLVFIMGINFIRTRRLSLYTMWIAGYIFIVWSEMAIIAESYRSFDDYFIPLLRFSVANCIVLFSYHVSHTHKVVVSHYYSIDTKRNKHFIFLIIVIFSLVAIVLRLPAAYANFTIGRQLGSTVGKSISLLGSFSGMLSIAMPAIIAWYYSNYSSKRWRSLWLAIPVMAISILSTTRFRMLYAVLPYMIIMGVIPVKQIKFRQIFPILLIALSVVVFSSYLKRVRLMSIEEREAMALVENYEGNVGLLKVANYMSPEGVVKMAYYADRYFENHSLHWGREAGFSIYFWIPRAIWKNKPTQLDHWLIREYMNVSDAFSTASGFIGELRADFGWGVMLFMVLFGFLLKEGDIFIADVLEKRGIHAVFAAILYPFVFFFVRSPLTSYFQLVNVLVIMFIISRFMNRHKDT